MIFPPTHKRYEFGDHCTAIDDGKQCNKNFDCGSCSLAWETYKKEVEDDREYIIPLEEWSKGDIKAYKNEPCTIAKVNRIEDLFSRFALGGVPFKLIENMNTDEMRNLYPFWFALKTLENIGEPLSYKGGHDIPLVVEYPDCVYLVAPVRESE